MIVTSKFEKRLVFKYVKISPKKMRRFLYCLKGHSVSNIKFLLKYLPYKACFLLFNLIKSLNFNFSYSLDNLYFAEVIVNEASFLKRFRPRAQGKAFPFKHRFSHIISSFLKIFYCDINTLYIFNSFKLTFY